MDGGGYFHTTWVDGSISPKGFREDLRCTKFGSVLFRRTIQNLIRLGTVSVFVKNSRWVLQNESVNNVLTSSNFSRSFFLCIKYLYIVVSRSRGKSGYVCRPKHNVYRFIYLSGYFGRVVKVPSVYKFPTTLQSKVLRAGTTYAKDLQFACVTSTTTSTLGYNCTSYEYRRVQIRTGGWTMTEHGQCPTFLVPSASHSNTPGSTFPRKNLDTSTDFLDLELRNEVSRSCKYRGESQPKYLNPVKPRRIVRRFYLHYTGNPFVRKDRITVVLKRTL